MKRGTVVVKDGEPACSLCGGLVNCSGTADLSFVSVHNYDGVVYHDWTDAGSAEFSPDDYTCAKCGATLTMDESEVNRAIEDDEDTFE